MAYATYTTHALVCGTQNRNTADRSYLLFTREAGMLYASARSVREERSRQRYALQDFSLVKVSLVKGARGWRIGSVEALCNHYHQATDKAARGSVVSVYRSLRRFIHGEEPAPDLFEFLVEALACLSSPVAERQFVTLAVEVRILLALGYVREHDVPPAIVGGRVAEFAASASAAWYRQLERAKEAAEVASHL